MAVLPPKAPSSISGLIQYYENTTHDLSEEIHYIDTLYAKIGHTLIHKEGNAAALGVEFDDIYVTLDSLTETTQRFSNLELMPRKFQTQALRILWEGLADIVCVQDRCKKIINQLRIQEKLWHDDSDDECLFSDEVYQESIKELINTVCRTLAKVLDRFGKILEIIDEHEMKSLEVPVSMSEAEKPKISWLQPVFGPISGDLWGPIKRAWSFLLRRRLRVLQLLCVSLSILFFVLWVRATDDPGTAFTGAACILAVGGLFAAGLHYRAKRAISNKQKDEESTLCIDEAEGGQNRIILL